MRRGFTLLELLVVIAIIAFLAALMFPLLGVLRFRSKVLVTNQRIDQVLSALQGIGRENGSASYVLQRDCGLGGTTEFRLNASNQGEPVSGTWHACYPDPAGSHPNPLVLAYPWGKARQYWVREAWYTTPQELPLAEPTDANRDAWYAAWKVPERHTIAELCATRSTALLQRAGVFEVFSEAEAVRQSKSRNPNRRWNDGWGQPLIVAYGIYQPTRCQLGGRYAGDYYVREALAQYQYNRSLYVAVGSPGEVLDPVLFPSGLPDTDAFAAYADWSEVSTDLWEHVAKGCTTGTQKTWDETSFDRPPWKGTRLGELKVAGKRLRPLISTPVEIK